MTQFRELTALSTYNGSNIQTDPTKGTAVNPYTQEEHDAFASGTWPGGYVEGIGYVVPDRQATALESSYPDTGNVMYPGIFVEAGAFHADNDYIGGSLITDIRIWWDSGFTGNINLWDDPDWYKSNIGADASPDARNVDTHLYAADKIPPVDAHWKKIRDNEYCAEITVRYTDSSPAGFQKYTKEYSMENLLRGINV